MKKNYKFALITGGSSGIGLALAKELAQAGTDLCLLARDEVKLAQAKEVLQALTARADQQIFTLSCDVSDYDHLKPVLTDFVSERGLPDLVINSAGVTYPGHFEDLDVDIFHWLMDVNYFGTLHVLKVLAPMMIERGAGTLVNISSQAGFIGVFGYSGYSASKYAVSGLSDVLRSELKPHGIQVSVVFPPDTETPQLAFEEPLKPFETKEIAGSAKALSAETVAKSILKGISKVKYVIIPGVDGKLFYWLTHFLGRLTYPVMDILVKNAQKKKSKQGE
ncbi:SDR family oxidoreductase [bacterium]|nr:SDR family oxidoreductase [bacterium]